MSITSSKTSPDATSAIKAAALSITSGRFSISNPLSFLYPESVTIPSFFADFLMLSGVKYATSKNTFLVSASICVACPPIIPAIAIGLTSSAITSSPFTSSLSTPSRVVIFSPFSAALTTTVLFSNLSKSKACIG